MAILGRAIADDPHVGGNWRHDAKRPKVQLSKRSERKTQSTRNKSPFSLLSLPFFHPPPLFDGKNCRRPTLSFSLLLTAGEEGFEWNGQDYPDLLFPFPPSLSRHDIPLDRRQEKTGWITWARKARRRGQSHSNGQFIRA